MELLSQNIPLNYAYRKFTNATKFVERKCSWTPFNDFGVWDISIITLYIH